mmetsp:Transcript_5742/g.6932  ORF Transcript_5742/g.6932 Transcript_5742/m.6932 type:complete len:357 (-) Transcript_5742:21-1091(-)
MSNETPCASDLDCSLPGTVCYGSGNDTFCDCITLYGWEGSDCSEFSSKYIPFVLVDTFAVLYALYIIYKVYVTLRPLKQKRLRDWFFKWGGMTTLRILLNIGCYFTAFVFFSLSLGLEVLREDKFNKPVNSEIIPGYEKQSVFTAFTVATFAIQIALLVLSILNLSVHWTELSFKQGGVTSSMKFGVDKGLLVRICAYLFELLEFLLGLIFFVKRDYVALVTLAAVTAAILYVTLIVSGVWYRNSLRRGFSSINTAGVNTPQQISEMVSITLCRIIPLGAGVLSGLSVLVHIFSGSVKEQSPPGKISPVTWTIHAVVLCTFLISIFIFTYISQIVSNQVNAMKVLVPSSRESSLTL